MIGRWIRSALSFVSTVAQVGLRWVKTGVTKLPASRVTEAAADLLEQEISDPSGRGQINRAGVLLGMIVCAFLLGKALLEGIAALLSLADASVWTVPYLLAMAVFTMVTTLVCTKMLGE